MWWPWVSAGSGEKRVTITSGRKLADDRHHVGQHGVLAPDPQRLVGALRETEVARAGEELLRAVDPARRQQLLRPDEAQRRPLLGADQVLPAVAARDRQIGRAHERAVGQVGEQRRVLVVGVGRDVEDAAGDAELAQAEGDLRGVRLRRRTGRQDSVAKHEEREENRKNKARSAVMHGKIAGSGRDGRQRRDRV